MSAHIERLRAAVGHEIGESPAETAIREAREEIGAGIRLTKLLDVLGGPDYEVTYPNGDRVAYVTSVYEAEVIARGSGNGRDQIADLAGSVRSISNAASIAACPWPVRVSARGAPAGLIQSRCSKAARSSRPRMPPA